MEKERSGPKSPPPTGETKTEEFFTFEHTFEGHKPGSKPNECPMCRSRKTG